MELMYAYRTMSGGQEKKRVGYGTNSGEFEECFTLRKMSIQGVMIQDRQSGIERVNQPAGRR